VPGIFRHVHAITARKRYRHDVPAWIKAMDVILHTLTKHEPLGRLIIEGMAAALPTGVAAAGGVTEAVRHGSNGWLVKPSNAAGLADANGPLRAHPTMRIRSFRWDVMCSG
jgi:glycosyltransferase involved in cell wall biosynthesis